VKYRINHQTEYFYGDRVPLCHNVIRLRPRDTAFQTCQRSELSITPAAADQREHLDYFGNHAIWIAVQEPHHSLKIEMTSEVNVNSNTLPPDLTGPPWDQVPSLISDGLDPTILAAREYTFDSPYIARCAELAAYAKPDFPPGAPLLTCIMNLTHRIFDEFIFDTDATTIGTPLLEILHHHHGVCQDFAHLQIGCMRSLGLPARYVSGYLVTKPPPGQRRLIGADASHAWISAYIPGYGWIDFDPTNDTMPNDQHITIGWARDYDDLSPVKGVTTGGHGHTLEFSVDVEAMAP
jgi:transglutaminase-like putative cysteine protease